MNLHDLVATMMANGTPPETILLTIKTFEDTMTALLVTPRTARQERNARYYAKTKERLNASKTSEKRLNKTDSDATSPPLLSPSSLSSRPPLTTPPIIPLSLGGPSSQNDAQPPSEVPKKRQTKNGTRLQPDWQPSEKNKKDAAEIGLRPQEIDFQAAKFRDYWLAVPGQKGLKLDWEATWRSWCRNSLSRSPPFFGHLSPSPRRPEGIV